MNIFSTISQIIKTASLTVAVLSFQTIPAMGAEVVEAPDFAFPQSVAKDAEGEMSRALASGDWLTALLCSVQKGVADGLISSSRAAATALMFDSVAHQMPAPYSSLALLLEARTYADIYESNRWTFDRRTLPADSISANPTEWSGDIFSQKITSLVAHAMKGAEQYAALPLSTLGGLATTPRGAMYEEYSVFDFMTSAAVSILDRCKSDDNNSLLPFGNNSKTDSEETGKGGNTPLRQQLLRNAISSDMNRGNILPAVGFILSADERPNRYSGKRDGSASKENPYLRQWIDSLSSTPYCAPLYDRLYSGLNPEVNNIGGIDTCLIAHAYKEITEYSDRFPEGFGVCELRNMAARFEMKRVLIEVNSYYVPDAGIKCKVTYSNLNHGKLLLVALNYDGSDSNMNFNTLLKYNPKVVAVKEIGQAGVIPFYGFEEIVFPGADSGTYVIVPSSDATLSGITNDTKESGWFPIVRVSGISVLNITGYTPDSENGVYVVSSSDMHPVAGAEVRFISRKRGKDVVEKRGVTDKFGFISAPVGNYRIVARKGRDKAVGGNISGSFSTWIYNNPESPRRQTDIEASVLTDLSVYRPGQKVEAAVVMFERGRNASHPVADKKGIAFLRDANYLKIDTLEFVTDRMGRARVEFTIPEGGLLGYWGISVSADNKEIGQCGLLTAEYKSPSFYVALSAEESTYSLGDEIHIAGKVATFSGMPVIASKISYTVESRPMPRMGVYSKAVYSSTATVNSDGTFVITLDTEKLRDTAYSNGLFTLKASATSSGGETQESAPFSFSIGERYTVSAEWPEYLDISDGEKSLPVKVRDIFGNPVVRDVKYQILKDDKTLKVGKFTAPEFKWPGELGCGQYNIVLSLCSDGEDSELSRAEYQLIVYNSRLSSIPVVTPLWVPQRSVTVDSDAADVELELGSSYPGDYIYVRSVDTEGHTSSQWLRSDGKVMKVRIPFASDVSRSRVDIIAMHNFDCRSASVMLTSERVEVKPVIRTVAFRDHLVPGEKERFRFVVKERDIPVAGAAFMAVMSNRALDAIAPFSWWFNASTPAYWYSSGQCGAFGADMMRGNFRLNAPVAEKCGESVAPVLNTYGGNFIGNGMYRMMRKNSAMKYAAATRVETEEVYLTSESVAATSAVMDSAAGSDMSETEDQVKNDNISQEYRNSECPLAFFKPMLSTGKDGEVEVDFEVPDFNGEWKLQLLAYDDKMRSDLQTMYSVASKPVMVSLNYPRFLYSNDRAVVSATVYNNSDKDREISGNIEVFDPITGKVVQRVDYVSEVVAPYGSCLMNIELLPGEYNILGIRCQAQDDSHSDGEQYLFPVLPASRPVVTAQTFYLSDRKREITMNIASGNRESKSEFRYCDNPLWECLTALPGLTESQSENALSIAESFYASALSAGIVKKYPSLARGIREYFSSGDTLVSSLENGSNFVNIALEATPWVNDAGSQTLRMNRLLQLTDLSGSSSFVGKDGARLQRLQNKDGGWSWCQGMESSPYITRRVISLLSYLYKYDCLPEAGKEMLRKGLNYYDSYIIKEEKRLGRKYDYLSLLDYVLVREECGGLKDSGGFEAVRKKVVEKTSDSWKKLDIAGKSNAARLLWAAGHSGESMMVLESLRQYASYAPDKGMWYDNLKGGATGMSKLQVTAMVLRAYSKISPQSPSVGELRQWLMLEKMAEDWGSGPAAADVVNSVIASMQQPEFDTIPPVIELIYTDGRVDAVELTPAQRISGNISIPLDCQDLQSVRVKKNNAIDGWGGVISCYVAPADEIKAQGSGKIRIERKYFTLLPSDNGEKAVAADIRQGDKVRVTLTVKADIDMDYVTISDDRSACLEPDIQTSCYSFSDGLWMYKEVCNEKVNFFIPHLPKGVYQISYDCHADRRGNYNCGIATAESLYWPAIVANSSGKIIEVNK